MATSGTCTPLRYGALNLGNSVDRSLETVFTVVMQNNDNHGSQNFANDHSHSVHFSQQGDRDHFNGRHHPRHSDCPHCNGSCPSCGAR